MRTMRWLAAAVMVAGLVAVVDAQPPQRQRPGGGTPGGPGGPGGGGGTVARLKTKSVAEDLKISPEQLEKLKAWSEGYPERIQAKIQAETYKELNGVLTPEQVKRLKQIEVQASGIRAFTNSEVSSALKLSDEQKTKIDSIREESTKARGDLFGGRTGGGRPTEEQMAESRKKFAQLQTDTMAKLQDVLTSEQKAVWKDLVGEPFDVSTLTPTFGGGGNRPGAGGTRPGGNRPPQKD